MRHSQAPALWYKSGVQAMFKLLMPALALFAVGANAQGIPQNKNSARMDIKPSVPVAAATTNAAAKREVATLAGGCFWGMEEVLRKIPGVLDTRVGYTGGSIPNPTYKLICTGITGHAEALEIGFDPTKITYEEILLTFFRMHDPTTLNQQHNDRGTQYRSAIFYHTDEQKQTAERVKARVDKSGKWKKPVVTEITKATQFYVAEDYHQKYLIKNPGGYNCHALLDMKF
jgi:methionine-S-sulfoxide reductase